MGELHMRYAFYSKRLRKATLFRVATSQGNLIFLQGQGILQIGQGNFKDQESQGKVRAFHNFGPKLFGL